jgi:aspartyl-tRNA(Asn)/glutamyl-tRNA(Gln) amidotransferase subunit C
MAISEEEVRKVARLARLNLTEDEVKKFAPQMEKILDYIGILNEVDTSEVPPTTQVTGLHDVVREDNVQPWISRDELLSLTPLSVHNNQVKVPSVFEDI